MRNRFKAILSLAVILSLALAIGCGKKDNPTTPTNTNTTTIPTAQENTVGTIAATQTYAGVESVQDNMDMLSGGGFNPAPPRWPGAPKSPPDTIWHYNSTTQWWWASYSSQYHWGIHLMPDPWYGPDTTVHPDSIEFKYEWLDTTYYKWTWYYTIGWQVKPNTVHGAWLWDFPNYVGGANYTYYWHMTFDNVGVNDHSGHFVYTGTYPVVGTTGLIMVTITGEITLVADGSGNGNVSAGGTVFCKLHFDPYGTTPRGYYTLLSENWATQHPFGE